MVVVGPHTCGRAFSRVVAASFGFFVCLQPPPTLSPHRLAASAAAAAAAAASAPRADSHAVHQTDTESVFRRPVPRDAQPSQRRSVKERVTRRRRCSTRNALSRCRSLRLSPMTLSRPARHAEPLRIWGGDAEKRRLASAFFFFDSEG